MRLKDARSRASRAAAGVAASIGRWARTRPIRSASSRSFAAMTSASTIAARGKALEVRVAHPLEPRAVGFGLENGARAPVGGGARRALMQHDAVPQQGSQQGVSPLGQVHDVD